MKNNGGVGSGRQWSLQKFLRGGLALRTFPSVYTKLYLCCRAVALHLLVEKLKFDVRIDIENG